MIANDEIYITIAIQICAHDSVPQPICFFKSWFVRDLCELSILLFKDRNGHPFTGNYQIDIAITINIRPWSTGDHPDVLKSRRNNVSYICKFPSSIIVQYESTHRVAIESGP